MISRQRKRRHGFTLIEMTVVITILAVMAAAIMPNLVAIQQSRELRQQEWALQRLPGQARDESRRRNAKVTLRMDGDDLVMSQVPTAGDGTPDTSAEPEEIKRVPLGNHLRIDAIRKGNDSVDSSTWQWYAYPDGSSDGAHLTVTEGDNSKSLVVPADKDAHWDTSDTDTDGGDDEPWQAGEVEQRGS